MTPDRAFRNCVGGCPVALLKTTVSPWLHRTCRESPPVTTPPRRSSCGRRAWRVHGACLCVTARASADLPAATVRPTIGMAGPDYTRRPSRHRGRHLGMDGDPAGRRAAICRLARFLSCLRCVQRHRKPVRRPCTAGYNYMLPSRLVVGAEADVSFPSTLGARRSFASPAIGAATTAIRWRCSARCAAASATTSIIGSITRPAASPGPMTSSPAPSSPTPRAAARRPALSKPRFSAAIGWTAAPASRRRWRPAGPSRLEYLYSQFGNSGVTFPLGGQTFMSDLSCRRCGSA